MSNAIAALEQAIFYHERREHFERSDKIAAAEALGRFGVFSSRQIGAILDLPHTYVAKVIHKEDNTGGRFDPKALEPLLKVARQQANGEVDVFAVRDVLDAGVTKYLASRLTGVARTTLERRYQRAVHIEGEAA